MDSPDSTMAVTNLKNLENFTNTSFDKFEKPDDDTLTFEISNANGSIVNGLRRVILSDILNVGFGFEPENTIKIIKNTTHLHDEFIAHRISMLPFMIPKWKELSLEDKKKFDFSSYKFILNVNSDTHKDGLITTEHFEKDMSKFFPKKPILITRIPQPQQELHIECTPCTGTHAKNAGFSPTTVCVSYPKNENTFHFMVETVSPQLWSTHHLVQIGIETLLEKLKSIQLKNEKKYNENYRAVEYHLHGENHTMGNIIQEWIYNAEMPLKKSRQVQSIAYFEPHPLENKAVIRISLDESSAPESYDDYRKTTQEILVKYIEEIKNYLATLLETWKNQTPH